MGAFLLAAAAAGQHSVIANLRTNFEPGTDFVEVRLLLTQEGSGIVFGSARLTAFIGDEYLNGVRVTEFANIPDGLYLLSGELIHGSGEPLEVVRATLFRLQGASRSVTLLASKPEATAEQSVVLLEDLDEDGGAGVGDVLQYTVEVNGAVDTLFDPLSSDLTLRRGTVTTSSGLVSLGNGAGNDSVLITDIDAWNEPTVIQYQAEVRPTVTSQGRVQFFDSPQWGQQLTDDPATALLGDATEFAVACSFPACGEELEQCRSDRLTCDSERQSCASDLEDCYDRLQIVRAERNNVAATFAEVTADPDGDGVWAILDRCEEEPGHGETIDERGCTHRQFCAAVPLQKDPAAFCAAADWLEDEPVGAPGDCGLTRAGQCWPVASLTR